MFVDEVIEEEEDNYPDENENMSGLGSRSRSLNRHNIKSGSKIASGHNSNTIG